MGYQPDVPGPGEDVGPDVVPSENVTHSGIDAEPAVRQQPRDWRRTTYEMTAWRAVEPGDRSEPSGTDILRRTGTEQAVIRLAAEDATEQRADRSAADLLRESNFDPMQDEGGPQSD